jgi:hypothetical protein
MHERQAQLAAGPFGDPGGQGHCLFGERRAVDRHQDRTERRWIVRQGTLL